MAGSEVRTIEACHALGVTPQILMLWERTFGFPGAVPGTDGRLRFGTLEIAVLKDALQSEHSVAAAISQARVTLRMTGAHDASDEFRVYRQAV